MTAATDECTCCSVRAMLPEIDLLCFLSFAEKNEGFDRGELSLELIEQIQAESMADDLEIEFERMRLWTAAEARAYFESGGASIPDRPESV